ncbi:transposase domain-containing protein (plasmid) [Streptomyces sp. NBC_00012]
MVAITRRVTVAAGRFAPGHLGELTAVVPFELVDAVLEETRSIQRRLRDLPSRVGVYFLLAMCLFPEVGYRLVWDKLAAGLDGVSVAGPTPKALRDLRRRLGAAPVRALTATILDILDRDGRVEMIARGHPPPVILRNGRPTTMDALQPAPPPGLGKLARARYHVDSFLFEPGDLLLLYTDGVTEARDSTGALYPLTERITGWTDNAPDAFLRRFRRDLLHHVGGHLDNDAAMIALSRA